MSRSRSSYDRFISVFSPEGKLYQVEYALNSVKKSGITTVALRGQNVVVFVSQRKVRDPLIVSTSVTSLYAINKRIGVCAIGRNPDCASAMTQARHDATDYWYYHGSTCPCPIIAQRTADHMQVTTQNAGKRIPGVSMIFASVEQGDGGLFVPHIYKVDPSGYCLAYDATAMGEYELEATRFLEKSIKKNDFRTETDLKKLIHVALSCLESVSRQKFKKEDVEIGYMTSLTPDFVFAKERYIESALDSL